MKVAIIGGGFAGLTLASLISKHQKETKLVIFERLPKVGKKIKIAGNNRCNLTNLNISSKNYRSLLFYEYIKDIDVVSFLKSLGLKLRFYGNLVYPYSEKGDHVLEMFLNSINAKIIHEEVISINGKTSELVTLKSHYHFDYIILATGSRSYFDTDASLNLIEKLSLDYLPFVPTLGPVKTFEKLSELDGVRVKAEAKVSNMKFSGEVLFKKDGLSGIMIFDLSRYLKLGDKIILDLIPEFQEKDFKDEESILGLFIKPLREEIMKRSKSESKIPGTIMKNFTFTVCELPTFKNSQVSIGGIKEEEVLPSFSLKKYDHIYAIGEVNNQDGMCGGYNAHFAIASAIKCFNSMYGKKLFIKGENK